MVSNKNTLVQIFFFNIYKKWHNFTASLSNCLCLTWNYFPSFDEFLIVVAIDNALEQPGVMYLSDLCAVNFETEKLQHLCHKSVYIL